MIRRIFFYVINDSVKPYAMAEVKKNPFTKGLSGAVGDYMVFRQVGNQTIVSTTPEHSGEVSDKQRVVRERFLMATIYAKSAIQDPVLKEQYEAKASQSKYRSGYHAAVADYLHAPVVQEIDIDSYTGSAGSKIRIRVYDVFKVQAVKVEIYKQDGSLLEQGQAEGDTNPLDWYYTTTVDNAQMAGTRIVIKAVDCPGNMTEKEAIYN